MPEPPSLVTSRSTPTPGLSSLHREASSSACLQSDRQRHLANSCPSKVLVNSLDLSSVTRGGLFSFPQTQALFFQVKGKHL